MDRPRIALDPGPHPEAAVIVTGLGSRTLARLEDLTPGEWQELLTVRTSAAAGEEELPPVAGRYRLEGGVARFEPAFPFLRGVQYVARWSSARREAPVDLEFSIEGYPDSGSTRVAWIYPTSDSLPENLLRLYVHFTGPMSVGEAARRIRLLGENGDEIEAPFVVPGQELWSPARDRLTLLFDPGRLKRDVGPNLELGPPLEEGRAYRLLIDAAWPDGRGRPLAEGFEKGFRVGPPDRSQPRVGEWLVAAPSGGRAYLQVRFREPVDHGLLRSMLSVVDSSGNAVAGVSDVADGEIVWRFLPETAWAPGRYFILVDPRLEDPSGNSLRRVFDAPQSGTAGESEGDSLLIPVPFVVADSQP
jgi:hypothetical protein